MRKKCTLPPNSSSIFGLAEIELIFMHRILSYILQVSASESKAAFMAPWIKFKGYCPSASNWSDAANSNKESDEIQSI